MNRQNRLAGVELSTVLRRIGMLAPDPGGMAIWTVDNYAAVEAIARNVGGSEAPPPSVAGVYRDFAEEIL